MGPSTPPHSRIAHAMTPKLHYVDWGGSGDPVLLLHGLASTLHIWDLVAPHLTAGRHVLAVDLRGHGLSEQPDDGYDFAAVAQDVLTFAQTLGLRTPLSLVGHSWGGYLVLYMAAHFPDVVADIVLVDGGVAALRHRWPDWESAEQALTPPPLAGRTAAEMRHLIRTQWLHDVWSPELEELAMHSFDVDAAGRVRPRLALANHMKIAKAIWHFAPTDYFGQVRCPTLLVMPIPPGHAHHLDTWHAERQIQVQSAAGALPQSRVAWLHETIHDVPWQRPRVLADLLVDFWHANARP